MDSALTTLLKNCLYAFNEMPNKKLPAKKTDTYSLASELSEMLRTLKTPTGPKIIAVVEGGLLQSISTNQPAQVILIDYDNLNAGDFPDCTPNNPDEIFKDGEAYKMFEKSTTANDKNICEQLQLLNF